MVSFHKTFDIIIYIYPVRAPCPDAGLAFTLLKESPNLFEGNASFSLVSVPIRYYYRLVLASLFDGKPLAGQATVFIFQARLFNDLVKIDEIASLKTKGFKK